MAGRVLTRTPVSDGECSGPLHVVLSEAAPTVSATGDLPEALQAAMRATAERLARLAAKAPGVPPF